MWNVKFSSTTPSAIAYSEEVVCCIGATRIRNHPSFCFQFKYILPHTLLVRCWNPMFGLDQNGAKKLRDCLRRFLIFAVPGHFYFFTTWNIVKTSACPVLPMEKISLYTPTVTILCKSYLQVV